MCLHNIDVADGLCNGTRLIVTQLLPHVIQGRLITGNNITTELVWIPRTFVTPPDIKFPFRMSRKQFLVTLAFAMTINKGKVNRCKILVCFYLDQCFFMGICCTFKSKVEIWIKNSND
ncbi:unnamed protein product [Brassica oleracea var. botrytis]